MHEKFCSQRSINIIENLFGTAPNTPRLLLIEYAKPWGAKPLDESKLDDRVKKYLKACLDKKIFNKILFIKNDRSTSNRRNIFVINNEEDTPVIQHHLISGYLDLLDIDFNKWEGTDFKDTMYLVCTNGKKDQCCAKFGLPFYNKLGKLNNNVWQCSHIGGDRFAPNVFTLPYGHFYGHLNINETKDFYTAIENHKIYFQKYRGRSCYSFIEQAAEYFLREKLQDHSFNNFKLLKNIPVSENINSIRFFHIASKSEYEIVIRSEKSEEEYFLTCKSKKTSRLNVMTLISITRNEGRFTKNDYL